MEIATKVDKTDQGVSVELSDNPDLFITVRHS